MSRFLESLNKYGFSKLNGVFDEKEKKILQEYSTKILDEEIINYKEAPSSFINHDVELYYNHKNIFTFFKTLNRNFIGQYEELDSLFSNLFSKDEIKNYFEAILGNEYKLHTCLMRKADGNSSYMGLHTDNNFAFTISILCNSVDQNHATTVFVPSSHKFNYDFKNKIEKFNPRYFSFLTIPSVGKVGDLNCFFNKTIHGIKQSSNKNNSSNIIWLLGFHRNSDKLMKTILLPKYTNYGKKTTEVFSEDALKLFELNENSRKHSNNLNQKKMIDNINKKNIYSIKQSLILTFLKFVGFNIFLMRKIVYLFKLKKIIK
jgi:putative 2OG-Fe(II) oxygenase